MMVNLHSQWCRLLSKLDGVVHSSIKQNIGSRSLDLVFSDRRHMAIVKLIPPITSLLHQRVKCVRNINTSQMLKKNIANSRVSLMKLSELYMNKCCVMPASHISVMIADCIKHITVARFSVLVANVIRQI